LHRLNLAGPFTRVQLTLDYARPRLWTLDVSDSPKADGYGSPDVDGVDSNHAETQVKYAKITGQRLLNASSSSSSTF